MGLDAGFEVQCFHWGAGVVVGHMVAFPWLSVGIKTCLFVCYPFPVCEMRSLPSR